MSLKDLGKGLLDRAIESIDNIDTDKIGEGLGKFVAKIDKKAAAIGERFETLALDAQEVKERIQDKVGRVVSDIQDKAYETAIQEDLFGDSREYKSALEKYFADELNKFSKIYDNKIFLEVLENFYNTQLRKELYLSNEKFANIMATIFAKAAIECRDKEEVANLVARKIFLIVFAAESREETGSVKYLNEVQDIIDSNKNQINGKIIGLTIKEYEEIYGPLNSYQKEVALYEAKYIGINESMDTIIPFLEELVSIYRDESKAKKLPFKNIVKAIELGILKNESHWISILKDKEACLNYIKKIEKMSVSGYDESNEVLPIDDPVEEELPIEKEVLPIVDPVKTVSTKKREPVKHIVKIYNDYYEMESFLESDFTSNSHYMTCSLINEAGKPEVNSEYIICSNNKNVVTYNSNGAFAVKMRKVLDNQESSVIECPKELLGKYETKYILIVKCSGTYCNLPIDEILECSFNSDIFTARLSDKTIISINSITSEAVEYNDNSEIMIDVLRQISENQARKLV